MTTSKSESPDKLTKFDKIGTSATLRLFVPLHHNRYVIRASGRLLVFIGTILQRISEQQEKTEGEILHEAHWKLGIAQTILKELNRTGEVAVVERLIGDHQALQ